MQNNQDERIHRTALDLCGLRKRCYKKELDDYAVDDDFLSFCGIKRRRWGDSKTWHIDPKNDAFTLPDYLEAMLADYTLAIAPTNIDTAPTPTPAPVVGMVLQLLLAETRRKVQLQVQEQQAHLTAQSGDASTEFTGPYWGYDQVITFGGTAGARGNVLDCELTYVLWYGDPRYLETNCVVITSEHPITDTSGGGISSSQHLPVLAAMSMVRHNRISEANSDIYGIFTDGFVWVFVHLNKRFKYSSRVLNWNKGQQRSIVELVSRIIHDAATIALLFNETPSQSRQIQSTWNRERSGSSQNEDNEDCGSDSTDSESATVSPSPDMDWFTKLENKIKHIMERRKNPKDILDFEEAFNLARHESHNIPEQKQGKQKQQKQQNLPTKAVTDIAAEDLWGIFRLKLEEGQTQTWYLAASERRGVSSHLRRMLADWDMVFRGTDQNEQVIRGRLNSIVVSILAAKKREEYGQHGAGNGSNKRTSTESLAQYKSLCWALEKPLTFKWKIKGKMTEIRGRMDFALWYGSREDVETNLVVVAAKRLHYAGTDVPQAIIYMAILHNARKQAERTNWPIYGIATDSWHWYFLRLAPNGVVSTHFVDWSKDPIQVISWIHKIIDQAACLTPVSSQSLSRQRTVEEASDLDWGREEE
ncbi:hypothetical protein BJX64DRAFT_290610 [Aspergillus heterothallicus]